MAAEGSKDAIKDVNIQTWKDFRLSPRVKELLSEKKEPYEKMQQVDCMSVTEFELT